MASTKILRAAARARKDPGDFMLARLEALGSQTGLAKELGLPPVAIGRALAEYKIVELKVFRYRGSNYMVERRWLPREDVLLRRDLHTVL